jgi:hypothetical protein
MNHQEMELNELINQVREELGKAQYSDLSIMVFKRAWKHLANYIARNGKAI